MTVQPPSGIEVLDSGTIVASGPEGVATYRLVALRSALRLQARTGMKMSRGFSAITTAQQMGLTKARTARKAFEDVNRAMVEAGFTSMSLD